MSLNLTSSLFLFSCLLLERKFFSSFLQSKSWSKSLENILSSEISHTFLSLPILLMKILCRESNRLMKYLFMFSTFEYSVRSFAKFECPLILWFCLIKYCPKNRHGLKRCLTYSSIWSVLFISYSSYFERAIMLSVKVGRSFYTRYRSL